MIVGFKGPEGGHKLRAQLRRAKTIVLCKVGSVVALYGGAFSAMCPHFLSLNKAHVLVSKHMVHTVKALLTHKISALITHTPKTPIPQRLLDFPIRKFAMLLVGQFSVCLRTHMPISSNVRHAGLSQGLWVMRASTRISYMG